MEIKRSIEISVETTRRFVVRQPETDATVSCPACDEPMLTAETSAALFGIGCRRVYQLVEAGAAHFFETETGALFVCPSSLQATIGTVNHAPSAGTIEPAEESSAEKPTLEIEAR